MNTQISQLEAAIEGLYSAFMGYKLAPRVEGCPHCVSAEDEQRLHAAPLRRLSAGDLSTYACKAMTTWGGVDDFRHFLPRLFELAALEPHNLGNDVEILFDKLRYGKWQSWPQLQQDAIRKYLQAFWGTALLAELEPYEMEEHLCCVGCVTDEVEPFLEAWIEPPEARRLALLSDWLRSGWALGDAFWEPEPRRRAIAWMLSERTSERLEEIFFESEGDLQAAASDAVCGLDFLPSG